MQSPIDTPLVFGWGQESDVGSPTSIADMMGEAYAPAPSPSSYSSLEGWAGSPLPKPAVSPINSPLPRACHYVDMGSPSVMEKAFDAAGCAGYDWHIGFGHEDDAHSFSLAFVGVAVPQPSPLLYPSSSARLRNDCHQGKTECPRRTPYRAGPRYQA